MTEDTTTENKFFQEYNSLNLGFKASIEETGNKYEVTLYKWSTELLDDDNNPLWERVAGPFVLDTLTEAQTMALENLQTFSGEIPDKTIDPELIGFVAKIVGHENFDFFLPQNFDCVLLDDENLEKVIKINPSKCLVLEELFFIEADEKWFTGFLDEDDVIKCWKEFENLEAALLFQVANED